MATLNIEFNCMCLFATRDGERGVHVLMPATASHGKDHEHLLRLLYVNPEGKTISRDMKGWALTLTDSSVEHESGSSIRTDPRIVNLTELTGIHVDPALLNGADPDMLAARVSINGGTFVDAECQPEKWELNGVSREMAHQVIWQIKNVPSELQWDRIGTPKEIPLVSLDNVKPQEDPNGENVYRIYVYHVLKVDLPKKLPPVQGPTLRVKSIMDHFPMYYMLLGMPHVSPTNTSLVPTIPGAEDTAGPPSGMHFCKSAQVLVGPFGDFE